MTKKQMTSFAEIIAMAFVKANRDADAKWDSDPRSGGTMSPLGVTGITIPSGLEVLHVPCTDTQQESAGITSKHSRGDSESSRLKQKKAAAVALALEDKLTCNNVLSIITSEDIDKHNLAIDCQQWQVGINGFKTVLVANDMLTPFLIPATFDLDDPTLMAGSFTNLSVDFHKISYDTTQLWQQFLQKYAAPVEIKSDS